MSDAWVKDQVLSPEQLWNLRVALLVAIGCEWPEVQKQQWRRLVEKIDRVLAGAQDAAVMS